MAAAGTSNSSKYTWAQVKEHNKDEDLWVVIRDEVYDLTSFLNEHPGGPEVLQEHAAKDATKDFDDIGHSKDAIELMKKYRIGDIVDEEKKKSKKSVFCGSDAQKKKICIGLCSVLALGVGVFVIYQGYKLFRSS